MASTNVQSTVRLRRLALCLAAAVVATVPLAGCSENGNFCIFGYTTEPLYDRSVRTVRVPIFKNRTFLKELEFSLTDAVVREIGLKTPYIVRQCTEDADTEILGVITSFTKGVINVNQAGENREAQTILTVEITWRDLRVGHVGEVLSRPRPKPGDPPLPPGVPVPPVIVQSLGDFIPEVGGSNRSAQKENVDRLAVQIVSMMEKPW